MIRIRAAWALLAVIALAASSLCCTGCSLIAFGAHMASSEDKPRDVAAQYTGLANQRIAVLVAADDQTQYIYPRAVLTTCRAVTANIAGNVAGVTAEPPEKILAFQQEHGDWAAMPPAALLQRLNVDRLVLIDLVEYATHDPGNPHLWRGRITANIDVIAGDAPDRDNAVFRKPNLTVIYPTSQSVGLVNSDEQTIQSGMLELFSTKVAWLFYDHKEVLTP